MGTSYGRKCILFTACRRENVPSSIRGKPQAMVPESDLILTPVIRLTTRVDRHVFAALSPTPTAPASVTSCRCQERHCSLRIRHTSKESEARLRGSLCFGTGAEVCVSSRHPLLALRHCDSGCAVASTLRLLALVATALPVAALLLPAVVRCRVSPARQCRSGLSCRHPRVAAVVRRGGHPDRVYPSVSRLATRTA